LKSKARNIFRTPREQKSNFGLAVWDSTPQPMPECHQHDDVEVNLLEAGTMTYLHGGRLVHVEKGALLIFWAGRPHQVIERDPKACMRGLTVPLSWFLGWELPDSIVYPVLQGRILFPPQVYPVNTFKALTDVWLEDLMIQTVEQRKAMFLEMEAWFRRAALAMDALESFDHRYGKKRELNRESSLGRVEAMARYIHEHYTETLSTRKVAEAVSLHPNYAVQLFHQKTGSTLVDFITKQRLAHAQLLLATTERQVLDVALESGFGSASRFYAVFRKAFEMSPTDYRAMAFEQRGAVPPPEEAPHPAD
jgi:AraC family transcriptional regulator, melibiose operon regulatory protein